MPRQFAPTNEQVFRPGIRLLLFLVFFHTSLFLPACTVVSTFVSTATPIPTTPEYIKDTVAYNEGIDGIVVYIVLAGKYGVETAGNGTVHLRIIEERTSLFSETKTTLLYSKTSQVSKSDFYMATLGTGDAKRQRLIYDFGRISYGEFQQLPSTESLASGKVVVEFTTTDGRVLRGKDSIFFNRD